MCPFILVLQPQEGHCAIFAVTSIGKIIQLHEYGSSEVLWLDAAAAGLNVKELLWHQFNPHTISTGRLSRSKSSYLVSLDHLASGMGNNTSLLLHFKN